MENLLAEFLESLQRLGVAKKDRLLLAVSGGLDSVVLTALCAKSDMDFDIAHVNFRLRGEEIEKCSIQVAARNLRYSWFKTFIGKDPDQYRFLLTAHHLDDNIETMLMHFFRGTGLSGLTGIPEKNGYIIRPLLSVSKSRLKE